MLAQLLITCYNIAGIVLIGFLIFLLALLRFVALLLPLWCYSHRTAIKRTTIFIIIFQHTITIAIFIQNMTENGRSSSSEFWFGPCQWVISNESIFKDFWFYMNLYINLPCGVIFSVLTAVLLICKRSPQEETDVSNIYRSSITIIIMNIGQLLFLILLQVPIYLYWNITPNTVVQFVNHQYQKYYLYYLITTLLPIALSAYNPLVICTRCTELKEVLRRWWTDCFTCCVGGLRCVWNRLRCVWKGLRCVWKRDEMLTDATPILHE